MVDMDMIELDLSMISLRPEHVNWKFVDQDENA